MASPPASPPPSKRPKLDGDVDDEEEKLQSPLSTLPAAAAAAEESQAEPARPPLPVEPGKPSRYKRRKIAIFFGYCGAGYQGMQKNPGARTIEAELEEALFLSWAVPEADRGNPRRCDWARSARTDKGVSAVGQVVSGRFYVDPPGLVERLNQNLDPQIRIFGFKRVTASFNAKKFCDRRRYVYLLPVFALDPEAHVGGERGDLSGCSECSERGLGRVCGDVLEKDPHGLGNGEILIGEKSDIVHRAAEVKVEVGTENAELRVETHGSNVMDFEPSLGNSVVSEVDGMAKTEISEHNQDGKIVVETNVIEVETAAFKEKHTKATLVTCSKAGQSPARTSTFHYGEKEKENFNKILKRYIGTHNFHNFTSRTKAEDPSAKRYIISFEANSTVNVEGIEFVKCEVVGQSFMLHQIRKMIGLAVAVMRNCASESLMDTALRQDVNINVPTAPEVGLYLDECLFASYNKKWKDHDELSMKSYAQEAEDFKMKYIHSHIASVERMEGVVAVWLHSLDHHNFPEFQSVEANGACIEGVPQESVIAN